MEKAFQLKIDSEGIGRLTFDLPGEKVNKLSGPVMKEFSSIIDDLSVDSSVKALVLDSGKDGVFIAGADIKEIESIKNRRDALDKVEGGHNILRKLAGLPFPTIALIDGTCLGGGMELALACTYRLVTDHPKTSLGLPEVSLGVLPGWGGTQRLPRLVGLSEGLKMILSGKPVPARKAWKIKLADGIFASEFKEAETNKFVQACLDPKGKKSILARRERSGIFPYLMEKNSLGRYLVFKMAKDDLMKKTHGHYPAPLSALEVVKETFASDLELGMERERKAFATLACSKVSKNLITLFYTSQDLKKDPGSSVEVSSNGVSNTGVLGAGIMGGGIAWLMSNRDINVRVKDIVWDGIAKGYEKAHDYYAQLVKIRKLKPTQANLKMHKISGTIDFSGFKDLDLVVEAIVEDMNIKKKALAELEDNVNVDTMICSNTSSLSITDMSAEMKHPERFVGMHFFNPVNRMPLVEIIPGEKTSPEILARAVAFAKRLGKTPVVVANSPGFLVNRILLPYVNEAILMLEEGIDLERVDKLILDFGMPMGPLHLADEVGLDVAYKVALVLEEAFGKRMKVADLTKTLHERQLFGKKGGKGFYVYKGKESSPNPEIAKIVTTPKVGNTLIDDKTVVDRAIHMMINEAALCLEEKIIEKPEYLDMTMIMGAGFPAFRGGLLRYADELGIANVVNKLKQLSMEYGKRFTPCELLKNMSRDDKTFYSYPDESEE